MSKPILVFIYLLFALYCEVCQSETSALPKEAVVSAKNGPQQEAPSVVYLNNAASARLDPQVQSVGIRAIQQPAWDQHGEEDQARIRQLFASMLEGATAADIAVMPSTAFAITLAAVNLGKQWKRNNASGGRILLLQDQFPSAVYPWQQVCDESNGAITLDIVPYPSTDGGWTEAVLKHLMANSNDILAVCLPPLHWSDGALLDLKRISEICHDKGIVFILDATQAVGIMPLSIRELRPAMLACSVHKWLRGPHGASLVYVAPGLHEEWHPLDQHARSRNFAAAGAEHMGPKGYPENFFNDSRKFDSGGKPNSILLPILRTAMELMVERINRETVQDKLQTLVQPLLDWALAHNFTMTPGPHAYHLFGLRPQFLSQQQMIDMANQLQQDYGIYIAVRGGAFRISPYVDTTEEDIARFIDALSQLCDVPGTQRHLHQ